MSESDGAEGGKGLWKWRLWSLGLGKGGEDEGDAMTMASAPAVQRLYDVCKKVFTSTGVPSEAQVANVRAVLDNIKPSDLGLVNDEQQNGGDRCFTGDGKGNWLRPRYSLPISYLHLYECDLFSMGVFVLPTSASIPLHNHPGMTVLSRLLYGKMHVRAYDWVDPHDERLNKNPRIARQAKLVVDHVLGAESNGTEPQRASATEVLYPTSGGNIHAFTALTPCAVLDVLAPPYSPATGRHCTYYRATSSDGTVEGCDQIEWLEEFRTPNDFVVQQGDYQGPRIIPTPRGTAGVAVRVGHRNGLHKLGDQLKIKKSRKSQDHTTRIRDIKAALPLRRRVCSGSVE
ncbi:plant cysteine oxidase 4 isoform X2 [Physcomitrium patens]|uniref:cysteine dioxygenase n=2 Tax=Physcomitrium patens TaxID=3218 RepID=A0A2K1J7L9_PHYPA|nr:plant cysteine oxidase 4-like isoform X2 [Physcomitrium patens]PNR37522.1 hypothetical protein PHYPA_020631 [Physcomitrium patens]|eukprot:XP_024399773.1 plant cysteine oxidase 4-like isoform X2 [Physcomitrella patens]